MLAVSSATTWLVVQSRTFGRRDVWAQGRLGAGTFGRRDVWAQGRLGACTCASKILGVWQPLNVNAVTGNALFSSIHLLLRQHHFHPEKICLLRIFALISVKKA